MNKPSSQESGRTTTRIGLRAVHRLLIRFAIALSVILMIYGLGMYFGRGDKGAAGLAVGGLIAFVVWIFYLRWFKQKGTGAA